MLTFSDEDIIDFDVKIKLHRYAVFFRTLFNNKQTSIFPKRCQEQTMPDRYLALLFHKLQFYFTNATYFLEHVVTDVKPAPKCMRS